MVMPRRAETADNRHDVADFGRVQARQDFVKQQKFRFGRQSPRKLKPLAPGDRERIGRPVKLIVQPDIVADLFGGSERLCAATMVQMRADQDVFPHGQAGKRLHDLECPRDTPPRQPERRFASNDLAGISDIASAWFEEAGDDGEQRGLAGAVRPDQRRDPSFLSRE